MLNPRTVTSDAPPRIQNARVVTSTVRPVGSSARNTVLPETENWPELGLDATWSSGWPSTYTCCRRKQRSPVPSRHCPCPVNDGSPDADQNAPFLVQAVQTSLPRISAPGLPMSVN